MRINCRTIRKYIFTGKMRYCFLTLLLSSVVVLLLLQQHAASGDNCNDDGYSMYVWSSGFDPTAPHCGGVYPPNKDGDNAICFRHNWDTPLARERLWASCFNPGREITRLFVSDMKNRIENNGYSDEAETICDTDLIDFLTEAHQFGVRVYALFSDSTVDFKESYMASYPKKFNENCGTDQAYFDVRTITSFVRDAMEYAARANNDTISQNTIQGVAVNNEYFKNIKTCDANDENTIYVEDQQDHLDKLQLASTNAAPLPLHFSVSWNWHCCSCSGGRPRNLEWPQGSGNIKTATSHMIDIVDSVDVQVAYIKNSTMTSRTMPAYNDWLAKLGKSKTSRLYTLSYTNPTSLCQTSYSPHIKGSDVVEDNCSIGNPRSEEGMYMGFDHVESQLPGIKGSIHFMNGVYGSGITTGWPVHSSNPTPSCPSAENPTSLPSKSPAGAPPSTVISFLTFEDGNSDAATFTNAAGTLIYPDCHNPEPSSTINPSTCLGRYIRNSAITWDWILYQTSAVTDASLFLNGDLRFGMDMFTHDAPVGTQIDITIEDSTITASTDFPFGRHSRYSSTTTTQNTWERLEFTLLDRPDTNVGDSSISAIVISFAPGQLGEGSAYYIDNLAAVSSPGGSNPSIKPSASPSMMNLTPLASPSRRPTYRPSKLNATVSPTVPPRTKNPTSKPSKKSTDAPQPSSPVLLFDEFTAPNPWDTSIWQPRIPLSRAVATTGTSSVEALDGFAATLLYPKDRPDSEWGPRYSTQIKSTTSNLYGRYKARLKSGQANPGEGLVSAFFIYRNDDNDYDGDGIIDNHEIDFELLNSDRSSIFCSVYTDYEYSVDDVENFHRNSARINLATGEIHATIPGNEGTWDLVEIDPLGWTVPGFDHSAKMYTYGFDWSQEKVTFWIDLESGMGRHQLFEVLSDGSNSPNDHIPSMPASLFFNVWHTYVDWWSRADAPQLSKDAVMEIDFVSILEISSNGEPSERPAVTQSPLAPSKAPTGQPTPPNYQPAAPPVKNPDSCRDSPKDFKQRNKRRSCQWVADNLNMCKFTGIAKHCPETCKKCAEYGCSDTQKFFWFNDRRTRKCGFVKRNPAQRCKKWPIRQTCRETCGICY